MKKIPLEPAILSLGLLLLALGAAALAYFYPTLDEITGVTGSDTKGRSADKFSADQLQAKVADWYTPAVWQEPEDHHRLFHSDEYLFYPSAYPNGDYIKKNDPTTRAPSGVLLSWYRKYGLDFTDPNVDREDPDNDGFSNIVEFKNDPVGTRQKAADCDGTKSTNPLDPKSAPDFLSRLRLQKYESRPFHIQFKGYQQLNGTYLFQIYLSDVQSFNQPPLKKSGDTLGFEGYTIGAFHLIFKDEKDPGTGGTVNTDESTLELLKPEINLSVTVPFRKIIDSPESTADFVILMPADVDKVIRVSRGKIFSIPYLPGQSFLVLDAGDNGAKIRDTKTQKEYAIPKLDPKEWDEVPLPPAPPTTPAP